MSVAVASHIVAILGATARHILYFCYYRYISNDAARYFKVSSSNIKELNFLVYLCFIDYSKAFDTVNLTKNFELH